MTEAVETITGRKLDARYTLLDKLGAGGQGEVWRAHDGTRGVDIALKLVNTSGRQDESWSALEHEYAIASRLDHPSILKVFPPERPGETMFLPMELAAGGDLRRLRGTGFLEIIPVLLEIAQALEHAHERGVVHRDLKPGNVLFDGQGRARLADFGVAETAMNPVEAKGSSQASAATRDTNRHGFSPFTASPAQLRGEPPTPADDVYGLGALAYELLSGYPPYYPHFDKRRAIEEDVPDLVPTRQIPPLLRALVMRMLEKNPRKRPRTMREVIDELDAALNDTLTYDFENVSPTASTVTAAAAAAASSAPQAATSAASHAAGPRPGTAQAPATNAAASPANSLDWTPTSQDRRAAPDRRGRRKEDRTEAAQAPPVDPGTADRRTRAASSTNGNMAVPEARASQDAANGSLPRDIAAHLGVADGLDRDVTAQRGARNGLARGVPASPGATNGLARDMAASPGASSSLAREVAAPPPGATNGLARGVAAPPGATNNSLARGVAAPSGTTKGLARDTGANDTIAPAPASPARTTPRSGAEALARIDAALERAAAESAAQPKPTQRAPLTPAEAAAIVAAARAAASKPGLYADPITPPPVQSSAGRPAATVNTPFAGHSTETQPTATHHAPLGAGAHPRTAEVEPAIRGLTSTQPGAAVHAGSPTQPGASGYAGSSADSAATGHAGSPTQPRSSVRAGLAPHPGAPVHNGPSIESGPSIRATPSIHAGPMHDTWGEVPLDGLPKVARLQPIRSRRWPWVFLGLLAGGAAAVYFWLPRFDTDLLPPEIASVVAPLQAALSPDSTKSPGTNVASAGTTGTIGAAGTTGVAGVAGVPVPAPASRSDSTAIAGTNAPVPVRAGTTNAPTTSSAATSYAAGSYATAGAATAPSTTANQTSSSLPVFTAGEEQRLRGMRQTFDNRLAALEARGAGVWGGREFATAKTRAAEAVGARDAGNPRMAQERLAVALKLLDTVEGRAPQALSAQVAAGEKALGAGQQEVAGQAFDLARRISPADRRASDGQRRTGSLNAVLPLLADAQNAESAHEYARAAQDYSQALFLDPNNATAKAGQARANAAFGDDNYAKAIGSGFAALGAGRLDEAHEAFVKARALKPTGSEASEGLRRVGAALTARGFASMRQRAAGLEAQERWDEAERAYEDVLAADPSLAFAQEGKARTTSRADLSGRLQQFLDRPDRLASPGVREDARALLETARAQSPQGPVIRSQIARLEILLPGFDRPVRLSLLSDNSTQVVISSIGSFGAFARRDIELRPGKYTVVGTRNGFRDVRREITVAPGQENQTIRVTCSEPI